MSYDLECERKERVSTVVVNKDYTVQIGSQDTYDVNHMPRYLPIKFTGILCLQIKEEHWM